MVYVGWIGMITSKGPTPPCCSSLWRDQKVLVMGNDNPGYTKPTIIVDICAARYGFVSSDLLRLWNPSLEQRERMSVEVRYQNHS